MVQDSLEQLPVFDIIPHLLHHPRARARPPEHGAAAALSLRANAREILAQVDACLPKDEAGNFIAEQEKSDVVHDLLAFLAERMLEMNKQKQQEIKGFLGWLEGFVGAKVEDLTPKTKLQSYYEHDYESFLVVLKKNRKKLAVDPARAGSQARCCGPNSRDQWASSGPYGSGSGRRMS